MCVCVTLLLLLEISNLVITSTSRIFSKPNCSFERFLISNKFSIPGGSGGLKTLDCDVANRSTAVVYSTTYP